jgi:hypothetical protein
MMHGQKNIKLIQTMFACIHFNVLECNNSYNIPANVSFILEYECIGYIPLV